MVKLKSENKDQLLVAFLAKQTPPTKKSCMSSNRTMLYPVTGKSCWVLVNLALLVALFFRWFFVTEFAKQSHVVRGGRFRIEFHHSQGNLTHTHGDRLRFRPRYYSPFFLSVDTGYPLRLQSPTTLHPYVRTKINLLLPRGCEIVPLAGPIRYLSSPITIFLGMWLVLLNA